MKLLLHSGADWFVFNRLQPSLFQNWEEKKNISLFMVHSPEIQENEVMELDMCHVLGVDFPSGKGKEDGRGGQRDLKEKLRVNI